MIVKATVYFDVKTEGKTVITDFSLYSDVLNRKLEEHLSGSTKILDGSFWSGAQVTATFVPREKALELLRTKK